MTGGKQAQCAQGGGQRTTESASISAIRVAKNTEGSKRYTDCGYMAPRGLTMSPSNQMWLGDRAPAENPLVKGLRVD